MDWRVVYSAAYGNWFKQKYPSSYKDHGIPKCKFPKVASANGLTKMIINYITWTGHHAERSNTMGRPVEKKVEKFNIFTRQADKVTIGMEWQKGTGTKGSSDVKAHKRIAAQKFPVPVYIEVKIGRDALSDDQKKYKAKVEATGALYWVTKTPEDFFTQWFDLK